MTATTDNTLIVLQDAKQYLRTDVNYIIYLLWVLTFISLSTPNANEKTETNLIASNVVHYGDIDDYQKHVHGVLENLLQWVGPLLTWSCFYFLNTMKDNVDTTTVSEKSLSRLPKVCKVSQFSHSISQCLVILALLVVHGESSPCIDDVDCDGRRRLGEQKVVYSERTSGSKIVQ